MKLHLKTASLIQLESKFKYTVMMGLGNMYPLDQTNYKSEYTERTYI